MFLGDPLGNPRPIPLSTPYFVPLDEDLPNASLSVNN